MRGEQSANKIIGLTALIHQCMYSGLELIVMAKFDLEKFCSHIQNHKITFAYVVSTVQLAFVGNVG